MSISTDHTRTGQARYIMIGGFLGAGKTTAVCKLARHLTEQGLRVGLITNDQGNQLVDTAMLASNGFPISTGTQHKHHQPAQQLPIWCSDH